jgi:hypothetical protein
MFLQRTITAENPPGNGQFLDHSLLIILRCVKPDKSLVIGTLFVEHEEVKVKNIIITSQAE